jgi:hypothetical protein
MNGIDIATLVVSILAVIFAFLSWRAAKMTKLEEIRKEIYDHFAMYLPVDLRGHYKDKRIKIYPKNFIINEKKSLKYKIKRTVLGSEPEGQIIFRFLIELKTPRSELEIWKEIAKKLRIELERERDNLKKEKITQVEVDNENPRFGMII